MARTAIRPELTQVSIGRRVARETILWRAFIYIIYMAGFACNICMGTHQRKSRFAVIETHVFPTAGVMAGGTRCTKLALMDIFHGVTRETIFRGPLENSIYVT